MDYYSIATILIVLSALFGYINVRFLKLPIICTVIFMCVYVSPKQTTETHQFILCAPGLFATPQYIHIIRSFSRFGGVPVSL